MHKFTLLSSLLEAKMSTNVFSLKNEILNAIRKLPHELLDSKYFPNKTYDTSKARNEIDDSETGDLYSGSKVYDENLVNARFEDDLFKNLQNNVRFAIYLWLNNHQSDIATPESIVITTQEKIHNGAIGIPQYDDEQMVPQSRIPVKKFEVSGKFITMLFHEIIDELRKRPKPNKSTKDEIYISRFEDSINSVLSNPEIISELHTFCGIVVHEAQHLAQHKRGASDHHYPNFDKNMLGNKRDSDGDSQSIHDYFAEYTEIDAYAVEVVSNLLLKYVQPGTTANVPKLTQLAKHSFYTEYNDSNLDEYTSSQIQLIKRRFMKKVVNGLNHYNHELSNNKK